MDALKQIVTDCTKAELPKIEIGDTVKVHVWIKEGEKKRVQVFEGTVIAKKHGGISETFTVRRVAHGCGVERVFPIHSPNIDKVELVRNGRVRRSNLVVDALCSARGLFSRCSRSVSRCLGAVGILLDALHLRCNGILGILHDLRAFQLFRLAALLKHKKVFVGNL